MDNDEPVLVKKKRPETLVGVTDRINTTCGHMYVTLNEHEEQPFEVFAQVGKGGGCIAAHLEALTRSITIGLRYGIPLKEYITTLKNIRCPSPCTGPDGEILSCADGLSISLTSMTAIRPGNDKD